MSAARFATIAIVAVMVVPAFAVADWTQLGYDAARTGATPEAGPTTDDVAWTERLNGTLGYYSPPLIIGGTAYVMSDQGNVAGVTDGPSLVTNGVYAVNLSTGESRLIIETRYAPGHVLSDGSRLYVLRLGGIDAFPLAGGPPVASLALPKLSTSQSQSLCLSAAIDRGRLYAICDAYGAEDDGTFAMSYVIAVEIATFKLDWTWIENPVAAARREPTSGTQNVTNPVLGSPGPQSAEAVANSASDFSQAISISVIGPHVFARTFDVAAAATGGTGLPGAQAGQFVSTLWAINITRGYTAWSVNSSQTDYASSDQGAVPDLGQPQYFLGSGSMAYSVAGAQGVVYLQMDGRMRALKGFGGGEIWSVALGAEDAGTAGGLGGGALDRDRLITTSYETLYAFNTTSRSAAWRFSLPTESQLYWPESGVTIADGTIYAFAQNNRYGTNGGLTKSVLYAFRLSDGAVLWKQEFPLAVHERYAPTQHTLSISTGLLLVAANDGRLVLVGSTAGALHCGIHPSTLYPAPGTTLTVDLSPTAPGVHGPASSFRADWGDGTTTMWNVSSALTHRYARAGDVTARFFARNSANQTSSETMTFHVGASPPQQLTALQQAFAPENQNLTFFVIGAIITAIGALFGLIRLRTRRSRLEREIKAVDEVYARTRANPAECEAALAHRKARGRELLFEGKLEDGQLTLLERHIDELARTVRLSQLDGRFDFLPHGMVKTLQKMLADGEVSAWEYHHFVSVLEADLTLTPMQKAQVRELIEGWYAHDSAVGANPAARRATRG